MDKEYTNRDAYPTMPEDIDPEEFGLTDFGEPDTETEEADIVLEFSDEEGDDYAESLVKASNALGFFDFEEILDLNDMPVTEATALLYEAGYIGLPTEIEDEEVPDNDDQEAEAQE